MVSKIVERILKKYLAPYIDGISRDGLSILKGDVSLQNLEIKAEAFDFLKPCGILLKSGKIGRLHLQIPWRQLTKGKITIELETVSVAVARIQGDIPDDARILWDNWQAKGALIEKKVQELQELAENAGGEGDTGYVGRWMHRLAQNIQVNVGGGIMLQGFDTKQTLSGGLLLRGLRVSSVGDVCPDPKVVSLQKRVEITDIAAYVTVDDGAPRYMLEPTRLVLSVDHRASNLDAQLEVLDREGRGSEQKGCRLAVSRTALYRLAVTFREMGAWQQHTQEVISQHCAHVRKDQSALEGGTYQQYTQLYRKRLIGKEKLSHDEDDSLQAIEEAVMSRHLARWRMEVSQALKTKTTQQRKGWRLLGRGQKNDLLDSQEEWDELQKQIREDQAHLADLDRPRTIAVSILVQCISAQLYDDRSNRQERGSELQFPEERLGYVELVRSLDDMDLGAIIKHDLRINVEQPRTSVKITPKVVADHERNEWSFGVCFGKMELWCDHGTVLRYISPNTQQLSSRLEPDEYKDIAICSRVQDDGRELISANVCLPPTQLSASPQLVAVVAGLVMMELPEPPSFGSGNLPKSANETHDEEGTSKHGYRWSDEWEDEFQDVVIETAGKQAERVQESALVFLIDVAVAAPQITVAVSDIQRIHMDLGHIFLKSDGVMKADNFRASLDLSNTQVTCITGGGPRSVELRYPLLEPISLTVNIAGAKREDSKTALQGEATSVPLDVELAVQLQQVKFAVYPQAVHVLFKAPQAFLSALDLQGSAAQPPWQGGQRKSVVMDNSWSEQDRKATSVTSGGSLSSKYSVRAIAAIKLISLGVFDLDSAQVARVDLAELCSEAALSPDGQLNGGVSMQYFLVEVKNQPLLQLRDLGSSTCPGKEALGLKVRKQVQPPITIVVHVCPIVVEWRKEHVKALIAAAGACAPGEQRAQVSEDELAEALVNQLSEAIEEKAKERRATLVQPRRSIVLPKAVPDDHPSREVARQGLASGGELPKLQSEIAKAGEVPPPPAIAVDAKFGGLLIKLHREEHERYQVIPVWRAKSCGPLVEWHAINVGLSLETFANGEARCRATLDSFSLLYDGQCIVAPWNSGASVFESEVLLFLPVEAGGPLHSVCFRGLLRKISLVLFVKHIHSIVDYVSSNIAGAVLREAAEGAKEAMEKPKVAESVVLWHIFVESPVLHLGRDEAVLKNSPAWEGGSEMPLGSTWQQSLGLQSLQAVCDDEFQDATDHPTPMVKEFQQYLVFTPGSIAARNSFEADGSDSPPFLCNVSFTQTNFDAVDLAGPASGCILKIDNWDVMVRVDSKPTVPMHISIGSLFHPIVSSLSPENLELVLDVVQENITYNSYFPQPVAAAPAAAVQPCSALGEELEDTANLSVNVRVEFEGLTLTLSRLSPTKIDDGEFTYEPLLGLVIREMRVTVDITMYSGDTPMALQLGVFLNSASADDLRPAEVRACSLPTKLLELTAGSGFTGEGKADNWRFVLDNMQAQEPYRPGNSALLLLFTLTSACSASLRVELRRPRIFALWRLVRDTVHAMSTGVAGSSMMCLPPPLPPEVPPPIEKLTVSALVQELSLTMYTSYERATAPLLQGIVSLAADLTVHLPNITFPDATLSDFVICRTEMPESDSSFAAFSATHRSRISTVQILTLPSLQVAGQFKSGIRQELELQVHALPGSIRLTIGDIPYLVAAIYGLGGDGRLMEKAMLEGNSSLREPGLDPHGACAGVLRLLAQDVVGATDLESLQLTGNFGDGSASFAVPWGRPLLVHVPSLRGRGGGGTRKTVCEGPTLQLTLHGPAAAAGSQNLGSLVLPVELCAGKGLDGALLLRGGGVAASTLGVPAIRGRTLPELQLQARFEPSSFENPVATGIMALCAASESFEDFVRPIGKLEDFLQESVPRLDTQMLRRRRTLRRSHAAPRPPGPVAPPMNSTTRFAMALRVTLDGLEASFLDDCQANVLPVLRLNLHPANSSSAPSATTFQAAQAELSRSSEVKVDLNPWRPKGQQIGVSVHVENCAIGVNYLNARAGCWEPFLEPWAVDFFFSKFEGFDRDSLPGQAWQKPVLNAKYPAAMEITLMSFGLLNVNITPQLCSLASFLLNNKEAYLRRVDSPAAAVDRAAGAARYQLLNLASAPVCLAVVKPGAAEGGDAVNWRVFEPCNQEAPLDPLLGNRSAEEWRLMADETVTCLVGLLPGQSSPAANAPLAHVRMSLSSTCSGLVPPQVAGDSTVEAACEVLLPHPSHHLMLVSSRLRVFNHTSQPLEVRFSSHGSSPAGVQVPHATPMDVLPNRLAYPPEIAAALGPVANDNEAVSMAPVFGRRRSTDLASAIELGPVLDEPDVQRLPPQHFCSAPLWAAGMDAVLQLRSTRASGWSSPVPLVREESEGCAVLLPSANGAPIRFYSYLSHSCTASASLNGGFVTAVHVCAPLQLLNATPVRLAFSFAEQGTDTQPLSVEVAAFSVCGAPSTLDPALPFSLSLALVDEHVNVTSPGASLAVPNIFDTSLPGEEVVDVPLSRSNSGGIAALGVTVSRGLAVHVSCGRWLVDRTGLGLCVLCLGPSEAPSPDTMPLPQVDGHLTLLDHLPAMPAAWASAQSSRSISEYRKCQSELKFYLGVQNADGHWAALAAVKLPGEDSGHVLAALVQAQHKASSNSDPDTYPIHVCLQAEAVSSRLTFGAPSQVISVLPQVLIYNQLNDSLTVCAAGDPSTEVCVPANQTGSFLRWLGEANASSGKLSLQFRPAGLSTTCHWSAPIGLAVGEASGSIAMALHPLTMPVARPRNLAVDMFTVELAERGGVVCFTVSRGSRCELQNFSCLVEHITLRPMGAQSEKDEWPPRPLKEFSAACCETVEFAWPTVGTDSQMEVVLAWKRTAGGTETHGAAPDVRKPGHVVFHAPDGWQAVVVETGNTGNVCWLRVQDVIWTTMRANDKAKHLDKGLAPAKLKVVISLAHVGLSLVSPKRDQELLYAELRNVAALLGKWEDSQCLEFTVTGIQVDNQLVDNKDCPVVVANRCEPFLQCKVVQQLPACTGVVGLDALGVRIHALELSINEGFLSEVVQAISDMLRPILSLEEITLDKIEAWKTQPLSSGFEAPPPVPAQIAINQFTFMGLEMHLWASMRLAKLPAALRGALGLLTVGSDRLSIQGATLQLDPEVFDNIRGPAPTVAKMILQRYWANLLISLASLLGRSTLLELPRLPVKWGRRGVESGMCAIDFLLSRTANVFELVSLDKQYVRQKRPLLGRQIMEVKGLRTGIGAAGQHLAEGVMHVGDIVREPIEGAREAGVKGFAIGVGRGIMGTVVEPVLGAVYGVQSVTRGVLIAAGRDKEAASGRFVDTQRRTPRVMYAAGAIREYTDPEPANVACQPLA